MATYFTVHIIIFVTFHNRNVLFLGVMPAPDCSGIHDNKVKKKYLTDESMQYMLHTFMVHNTIRIDRHKEFHILAQFKQ